MTKNQAIRDARDAVSIHPIGNQYYVRSYDPGVRAYREGPSAPYWQALHNASQTRVNHARRALDLDPTQYHGGPWTDYLTPDA